MCSCTGGGTNSGSYVGEWSGTADMSYVNVYGKQDKYTTYNISVSQNGACIIKESRSTGYTNIYKGTWEKKSGYIGDGQRYEWIEVQGVTDEATPSEVYSPRFGYLKDIDRKSAITLSFTIDGKLYGGNLSAKRLIKEEPRCKLTKN